MRQLKHSFFVLMLIFTAACASHPSVKHAGAPLQNLSPIEKTLADYKSIASHGGWGRIPEGPKLQKGSTDERVVPLRKRLLATGDLAANASKTSKLYDDQVEDGVRSFQTRHGLEPDGALGKETLATLNIPVEDRIRQLEVNLEWRKSLPEKLGNHYIIVNIPDFKLRVFENAHPTLEMKVVVGQKKNWQTPLLSSTIHYMVVNPKWNVPSAIFEKELLRDIRKDPQYLTKHHMKVLSTSHSETQPMDADKIDWSLVNAKNPNVRIVQAEGAGNSLGRIKFIFPNPYSVYLHDTPEKKFFARNMRALSHGCVRVEKPIDLAENLMSHSGSWPREKIVSAINAGKNRDVPLPEAIGIYIVYRTAWVDEQGKVQFRNDVYGLDAARESKEL